MDSKDNDLPRQASIAGDTTGPTPNSKRGTRSRSGCVVCRARKVKCDERPGNCLNCETLNLKCPGYGAGIVHRPPVLDGNDEPYRDLTEAGTKRKRTYRSCKDCRNSKTRCSGDRPQCVRCKEKSIDCQYDADPAPAWARTVSSSLIQQHASPIAADAQSLNGSELRVGQRPTTPVLPGQSPASNAGAIAPAGTSSSVTSSNNYRSPQQNAYSNPHPHNNVRSPSLEASSHAPSLSTSNADEPMVIEKTSTPAVPEKIAWLLRDQLPQLDQVKKLVDIYWVTIYPLRCFGFIHKPSYMKSLDGDLSSLSPPDSALLHIICALGAKFLALEYSNNFATLPNEFILSVGNQWAKKAKSLVFEDLGDITIESLEASILLQDHELRAGQYASAFMLTALAVRMAQALQIHGEQNTDLLCNTRDPVLTVATKETRRRLMWCCFIMDCWVGSGVDPLTLLDEHEIKIQLPCQELSFTLEVPAVTQDIEGKILEICPEDNRPGRPTDNMGLLAFFIQITSLRKRVLRYVKHLDKAQYSLPWLPESEFNQLAKTLSHWHDNLPSNLQFTDDTMYKRKETSQLGALFLLHCAYHETMVDLYRIGMPQLFRSRFAALQGPGQTEFLLHCQHTCFEYAKNVAVVIAKAVKHGPTALADSWFWVVTYDSIRIMLYYLSQVVRHNPEQGGSLMQEAIPLFQACLKALKLMIPLFASVQRAYDSACQMLRKAGFGPKIHEEGGVPEVPSQLHDVDDHSAPGTPVQVSPENVFSSLNIYRLTRKAMRERNVTEPAASPMFSMNNVSQSTMHSPVHMGGSAMSPPMQHRQNSHSHSHTHNNNNSNAADGTAGQGSRPAPLQHTNSYEDHNAHPHAHAHAMPRTAFPALQSFNPNEPLPSHDIPPFMDPNLDDFETFSIIDFDGPWQLAGAAMDGVIGA